MAQTFEFDRDDLIAVLKPVSRFVGKSLKSTSYIRLFSDGDLLAAEATNGRASARMTVDQEAKRLEACVHPKLLDAIRALPDGSVELTISASSVEVSGRGKTKFTVPVNPDPLPETGLDKIPDGEEVEIDDLLTAIEKAARFASDDTKRPAINGVHLMVAEHDGEKRVAVASTDSYRFFYEITDVESFPGVEEGKGLTLPLVMAKDIKGLISGKVLVSVGDTVVIRDGMFRYWSHIPNEPFPNVAKIIEMAQPEHTIRFGKMEADREMERASVLAESGATIKFQVRDAEVIGRVGGAMGSSEIAWDADSGTCRSEADLKFSFLRNGIGAVETDEIRLGISDNKMKPILIQDEEGKTSYVLAGVAPTRTSDDGGDKPKTKTRKKKEEPEPAPEADEDDDDIDL